MLAAELGKKVVEACRNYVRPGYKVVVLGEALGHAFEVAVAVCLATEGKHVWKVVYRLVAMQPGKLIASNGGVCPQDVKVCAGCFLPAKLAGNRSHWETDGAGMTQQPSSAYVQEICTAPH